VPKEPIFRKGIEQDKLERAKQLRQEMTHAEQVLWQKLRANRLAGLHFRRQQVLHGFIADFYCHTLGLVVEVDGTIHRTQRDYDQERDTVLIEHGLTVLRFSNRDVLENLDAIVNTILQTVHGMGTIQDLPSCPSSQDGRRDRNIRFRETGTK
jgi:very-short-patch-repair endonuclease